MQQKILGILSKVRRYFTPKQLLQLYQAQVQSCMETDVTFRMVQPNTSCRLWIEKKMLIVDPARIDAKLQTFEHRRRVARLSVFYKIHFGECAKELHKLIPLSTFRHRDTRRGRSLARHVVDMPPFRASRFGSSFPMHTAKEWNALPANVFPEHYNLDVFKTRVNRLSLARPGSSSTASSLNIR